MSSCRHLNHCAPNFDQHMMDVIHSRCLYCRNSAGGGFGASLIATSFKQTATLTKSFSYDCINSSYVLPNVVSTGAANMVLAASNLVPTDVSQTTRISRSGSEASNWKSDSSVVIKLPGGRNRGSVHLGITAVQSAGTYSLVAGHSWYLGGNCQNWNWWRTRLHS